MKDRVEIIARTERRRKSSDAERAAILADADEPGLSRSKRGILSPLRRWLVARGDSSLGKTVVMLEVG